MVSTIRTYTKFFFLLLFFNECLIFSMNHQNDALRNIKNTQISKKRENLETNWAQTLIEKDEKLVKSGINFKLLEQSSKDHIPFMHFTPNDSCPEALLQCEQHMIRLKRNNEQLRFFTYEGASGIKGMLKYYGKVFGSPLVPACFGAIAGYEEAERDLKYLVVYRPTLIQKAVHYLLELYDQAKFFETIYNQSAATGKYFPNLFSYKKRADMIPFIGGLLELIGDHDPIFSPFVERNNSICHIRELPFIHQEDTSYLLEKHNLLNYEKRFV